MDRTKFTLNLPAYTTPIFFLVLSLLAFGLLVRYLGFYWDDWPAAWYYHLFGSQGYDVVFAADRPLLGWLYRLTTPLMGVSTLRWHIFALLTRWLSASIFWLVLRSIWPRHTWQVTITALLFLLYPGFAQQPIAITYSHAWLLQSSFLASLGLMVLAVRNPRWFWPLSAAAWGFSALTLFTVEYFFGLEFLRPLILWIVLAEYATDWRTRLKRTLSQWLPFILISVLFLVWRIFLTETPRGQVTILNQILTRPYNTLVGLFQTIFADIFETSVSAWGEISQFRNWFVSGEISGISPILLVLAAGILTGLFFWFFHPKSATETEDKSGRSWGIQAVSLGLAALFLGGIPFWATDLPIELRFPWDRFTLAMMFGVSLLLGGLFELIVRNRKTQIILLSITIGLTVGLHYLNSEAYQRRWSVQKDFFWQLTWRAPSLKSGTLLLTDSWPFDRFTDNSLAAPLNWIYAPDNKSQTMEYMVYDISSRLGLTLPDLEKGSPVVEDYRATEFRGSTSQALVFYYDPPACLRILDPVIDSVSYRYPNMLYKALPLSDLNLINTTPQNPAEPPLDVFGSPPVEDWCTYYQKAELALQKGDFITAAQLGDEAFEKGMFPRSPYEFFPLIQANAMSGRWNKAQNMTHNALEGSYTTQNGLCLLWKQIAQNTPESAEKQSAVEAVFGELNCYPATP